MLGKLGIEKSLPDLKDTGDSTNENYRLDVGTV